MRECNGCHLPNARFYDIEQMLRVVGQRGAITCLHVQLVNDPLLGSHSDDENENWYLKLREGFAPQGIPPAPERLIHVRCYHPHSLSVEPRGYAEHIVKLLSNWQGSRTHANERRNLWLDPFLCVSSSNELNLHSENGDSDAGNQWMYQTVEHYEKIAAWDMAFWQRVDELVPGRKALRCSGAFADGHEPASLPPDGEYTIPAIRAMLSASEIIACHPYALLNRPSGANDPAPHGVDTIPGGQDQFWYMLRPFRPKGYKDATDPGGMLAQIPSKPFLVSESGTFTHSDTTKTDTTFKAMLDLLFTAERTNRCLGVTWFIWNSDGAHQNNEIWRNQSLRGLLEHAPRYVSEAEVPVRGATPVPPTTTPAPRPPTTTPPPPTTPAPLPPAFNPNPFHTVIFPDGAIYQELARNKLYAMTGECRAQGDDSQIVFTVGVDPITGKRALVCAWQDPHIREGEWYSMLVAKEA